MKRIIVSGGGTAGSVTPLLAAVEALRRHDSSLEYLFVGTKAGLEKGLAELHSIPFRALATAKFRRYWSWRNFADIGNLVRGFLDARKLIASWKPDTILTAGASVSVPLVWAAKMAGCRIFVHQLDLQPGLANRLMAPLASIITVTFEKSMKYFPAGRCHLIGNPIQPEFLHADAAKARATFRLISRLPVLVVLGGSTGSVYLNTLIGAVAYRLVKDWQIIHVTGPERNFVELQDENYHRVDFLTWEMPHVLAAADLVVCRAGLGTITELAALGKPAVFIPMPDTHQEENTRFITQQKAGLVLSQTESSPDDFYRLLEHLRRADGERAVMARNLHQLHRPRALEDLVRLMTAA